MAFWICSDWKIDWSAISAVMTGAGAIAAAYAGWAAKSAAQVALRVDANQAAREKAASKSRFQSIAIAIAIDCGLLIKLCVQVKRSLDPATPAPKPEFAYKLLMSGYPGFETPALNLATSYLADIDADTGAALLLTWSAASQLREYVEQCRRHSEDKYHANLGAQIATFTDRLLESANLLYAQLEKTDTPIPAHPAHKGAAPAVDK